MRVMIVNPRFHLPIDTRTTPHLGLAYLAAVSEQRGDEVMVFDSDVEDEPITEAVRRFQPEIVGITANTPQVKSAWRTAQAIKSVADIPVVLGGPHVSVLPAESARRPEVDVVVRGEGEAVWVKLCEIIERAEKGNPNFVARDLLDPQHNLLDSLLGISYTTSDGQERHNPDHPAIADLDTLPFPAYHFFKMDRFTNHQPATDAIDGSKSFSVMTSRGCPYRCTFCSQSIMPLKWRARRPESVLKEWQHLVHNLGARIRRAGRLGQYPGGTAWSAWPTCSSKNKVNHVPWILSTAIRANLATKNCWVSWKAGLKRVAFGVESGDPDVLLSIDKKVTTIPSARPSKRQSGQPGNHRLLHHRSGQAITAESPMDRTIKFACEVDPLIANFSMMTPYPGTKVYEIAKRQGRLLLADWEDYVFFDGRARYELGDMTAELVQRKWKEAYRRFYLRPHRIAMTLRRKDFWINWRRTFKVAYNTIFPKKEKTELRQAVESAQVI